MGKRGPKPLPTAVLLSRGSQRAKERAAEPVFSFDVPSCPDFLDPFARQEWRRLVPELRRNGILTTCDRAALAAYCQAYGTFKSATKELREWQKHHSGSLCIATLQGYLKHPAVQIQRDAGAQMVKFAAEFGFTPSSRSRVTAPRKPENAKETDENTPENRYFKVAKA